MKILCVDIYKDIIPKSYHKYTCWIEQSELEKLNERMPDILILICQPFLVTSKLLKCLPRLEWIQLTGSGYDELNINEIKRKNIILTNTRGVMSVSIAEDVICKMMFFARKVRLFEEEREKKHWTSFGYDPWMCDMCDDLYGKTIGIIGNGEIARELAKRVQAFDMKIILYGRHKHEDDIADEFVTGKAGLSYLAENSDYVVCAIAYNKETHHLINKRFFEEMKDTAVLINVARGSIVNEMVLIDALRFKKIRAAALDVVEKEPLQVASPLWLLPNVYITFHKAGSGDSWKNRMTRLIEYNLKAFKENKKLTNTLF